MKRDLEEQVNAYKALNDVTRLKILEMLQNEPMYTNKILEEFNLTQPTLSYHMKILTNAHLLQMKKTGRNVYYRINKKTFAHLTEHLQKFSK